MKTLRLVVLMFFGAFMGQILFVPDIGDRNSAIETLLAATLSGAFCGLGIEIVLRAGQPSQKIAWRFSIRSALLMVAIVATALWVIVMLWNFSHLKSE